MRKNSIANISGFLRNIMVAVAFRPFLTFFFGFVVAMVITAAIFALFFGIFFNKESLKESEQTVKDKAFYVNCNAVFDRWQAREKDFVDFYQSEFGDPFEYDIFATSTASLVDQTAE